MEVTRATADFSGGKADFRYLMAPLGKRDQPARAVFDVDYRDVDLTALTEFYEMHGLRLAGRASGHNEMSWPLGRYVERRGSGTATFYRRVALRCRGRNWPRMRPRRRASDT